MESISSFLKNLTPVMFLKIAGFVVLAIFVLSLGASFLKNVGSIGSMPMQYFGSMGFDGAMSTQSYPMMAEEAYRGGMTKGGEMDMMAVGAPAMLSTRNIASDSSIMPIPPIFGGTTGSTAEDFEVTDYNAYIETSTIDDTCGAVSGLKGLPYVIFESANESTRNCNYSFKVEHAHVGEILAKIEALDPKSLSENTYTIKRQLDDFTSETEILEKKRASIDETLETALEAYDDITALATKTQDAESLARIITSKVSLIERLTQERININQQLDYISRAKEDQLDRLKYTYFYVNVSEKKYLDGEAIADAWYAALQGFVGDVNKALMNLSIYLVKFVLELGILLLYLFIVLIVAKYVWRFGVKIWKQ